MGKWVGNTPKYLYLFSENGVDVIIPVGLLSILKKYFNLAKYNYSINLSDDKKFKFNANVALYDYQKIAVDSCVKKGYGILIAPTGSGKTQMGIALICNLGYKALWITHTTDLLNQSYDRASQYIDKKYLGKITGGKKQIGSGITFATIQTLANLDLLDLKNEFNVVIVDECHRLAGTPTKLKQFSKVVNSLAARHKYGLTATLHRSDGLEKTTMAYLGSVCFSIEENDVKDKIISATVFKINTGIKIDTCCLDIDGTINYNNLINYLAANEDRNKLILRYLLKDKQEYNLILSQRIEHLISVYNLLPDELKEKAVLLNSKMSKNSREQAILKMQAGEKNYMFATYSLAKEGLDIKRLNRLHLILPTKDKAVVQQSVGRIRRCDESDKKAIVYDYVDDFIKSQKDFKTRKSFYKNINCEVFD